MKGQRRAEEETTTAPDATRPTRPGWCRPLRRNEIVRFLLDAGPYDMNKLALMPFGNDDREQLAQLIGYSVSGFGELSYVSDASYEQAKAKSEELLKRKGK